MKILTKISVTIVLGLFCTFSGISQDNKKQVQIRIIENGKVKTDTTFIVDNDVDKSDINQIRKILNYEDVLIFKDKHPGKHKFVYEFNHMPNMKMNDSLFQIEKRLFVQNDSIIENLQKHMLNDSLYSFHFKRDREFFNEEFPFGHDKMMPLHKYYYKDLATPDAIHKEIIIDDEYDTDLNEDNAIIIEKSGKGKRNIIIEKHSQPEKIIRKKLDDDTEIIIIKKDYQKSKPKKDN